MGEQSRREHILQVLREEYPNGATPAELRARMARGGRVYTLENIKTAITTLRRLRLVTFETKTQLLVASDPAERQRLAEQALSQPSPVNHWGR